MICSEATGLLAAHADGELDPMQDRALQQHLAGCPACAAESDAIASLGRDIRAQAPYYRAPESLRARVLARAPAWPQRRRWLAAGALAGALATVGVGVIVTAVLEWRASEDFVGEAVASHVRATLGNHLVEVVSSDQHTVKPWLSARLDYSPPVVDLQGEGFPLVGARIDYLDQRPVATLVYRFRSHVIDVFVRPRPAGAPASGLRTVRGFNVVAATGATMEWRAVADVQADVLAAFVARLAREDAGTPELAR